MNYEQTLEFIYARLPMFSHLGTDAYRKDLTNTIALCNEVGNPETKLKTIHIAGTNGKGSTSHMLASVLQTAGYKTGLYTSPHLKDFRERIKINGSMIPKESVIAFIEKITPQIDKLNPSFFEITVAMALEYFVDEGVQIAVIETGLGGRLDSTNIIRPEVSVITNIGWDHMNLLGDTLEKIAGEKAGIIKNNTPVVIGEVNNETRAVFEKTAKEKNAPISFATEHQYVAAWENRQDGLHIEVAGKETDHHAYVLDLHAAYQIKNILTVLETLKQLKTTGWNFTETDVREGLKHAKKLTGLHGRWEQISQHPAVVLDVAHNEDGMRELVKQLETTTYHKLHIVIGMVKDKVIDNVLALLPKLATYYFTRAKIPRALPENQLAARAVLAGLSGNSYPSVEVALAEARENAAKDDLILVCGSVFVVGEVAV
ncbi:MAG: bifunctional folylpolyglutamate synthase/dihydrofolate synthase [Gemmatimonadaceae bacterium]|nr:bifunctional folylpolyglutamate synthase/dihydrofolate synthase [Chitinophagaceae bacterium]